MAATLARRPATSDAAKPQEQPAQSAPADRKARGKRLRDTVPHFAHATWRTHAGRADPLSILRAADATRQKHLVPLRYGRMLHSPFTFYRGSAGVMAADLARTPAMGMHVQACGDAHLMNFGGFATPERRLIFDINDLDETLPAPWEWDVKRIGGISPPRLSRRPGRRIGDLSHRRIGHSLFWALRGQPYAARRCAGGLGAGGAHR